MRHSSLRFVAIALFLPAFACTADGADGETHGPVYGPNEAGSDVGAGADGGVVGAQDGNAPPVDATLPPPPGDAGPDAGRADSGGDANGSCTDKTAVLSANGTTLFQSVAIGAGAYSTTAIAGTYHGGAALAPVGGGFHGVVLGNGNAIEWTAWAGAAWSAPANLAGAVSMSPPALATIGNDVHVVYRGTDAKYYHGTFTAGAWDAATDPVGGAAAQSFGPTAVGMATVGGALLFAHPGGDNTNLYAEGLAAGSGVAIGAAQTETLVPSMIAVSGATLDAMVVYVHLADFKINYATRAAGAWTDHGAIDSTLFTGTGIPVAAAALGGGKAVLVFQGSNGKGYASTFDGTSWALPATNIASAALGGLPTVAPGACGDDAIAALPLASGAVQVVRLRGGAWGSPADVTGTSAANVVAIATSK